MTVHHQIPASQLQFAVLSLEEHERGRNTARLDDWGMRSYFDELQSSFPTSLESLRVIGWRGDRTLVACACTPELIAALPQEVLIATPDDLPTFVREAMTRQGETGKLEPSELNFLVGDAEPATLVSQRERRVHGVGIAACSVLLLMIACVHRFAAAQRDVMQQALEHHNAIATATFGAPLLESESMTMSDATRLRAMLEQERDELALTRTPTSLPPTAPDAAASLAALLAVWPSLAQADTTTAPVLQTTMLAVAPDTITASVTTSADPREFLDRLKAPEGWVLEAPRMRQGIDGTLLSLQLRPTPKETAR
jgi:hypothetical protein